MIVYNQQTEQFTEVSLKQAMIMILSGDVIQVSCNPKWAYRYASDVIGKPWPPGEAAIAKDPDWAYRYAIDLFEKPWPAGEAAIAKDPKWAYLYALHVALHVIGDPWPPGEAVIADSPEWAYAYARDVLYKRWNGPHKQQAENSIASDESTKYSYARKFNLTYDEENQRFTK
jgi:lambda repressor-like predicted transcriptional regulator